MRSLSRPDLAWVAIAVLGGTALVVLGAGLTFFADEWAVIEGRSLGDPATWFAPHNEHWATLQILAYRLLVEGVGLASYVPYQVLLIATHVLVASLVYLLIKRTAGAVPAVGAATLVLFLGSGFENLFWAFQIGFAGALACGLAAVLTFDAHPLPAKRALSGSLLLLASMALQGGPGLVLTLVVGVELMLDPQRRRWIGALAIPIAAYAAWYLIIGRTAIEAHQGVFSLGTPDKVAIVIATGWVTTAGSLIGVGPTIGVVALAGAVAGLAAWWLHQRRVAIAPRLVASIGGITALYGLIGLARAWVGPDVAQYTRYTYISAVLLIVGVAAQVGPARPDSRGLRLATQFGAACVLTLSLVWNARLLVAGRDLFANRAEVTRAFVQVALERPLPATTDPDRTLVLVPSPNALERIVGAYGSPLDDTIVPWAVRRPDPETLARARQVLAEGAEIPLPGR
jgi:hypothetical protein